MALQTICVPPTRQTQAENSCSEFAVSAEHQTNLPLTANIKLSKQLVSFPGKTVMRNTLGNISRAHGQKPGAGI